MSQPFLDDHSQTLHNVKTKLENTSKKIKNCQRQSNQLGTNKDNQTFRSELHETITSVSDELKNIRQLLISLESNNLAGSQSPQQITRYKRHWMQQTEKFKSVVKTIYDKESRYTQNGQNGQNRQNEQQKQFNSNSNIVNNDSNNNNNNSNNHNSNQQQQMSFQMLNGDSAVVFTQTIDELERREEKMHNLCNDLEDLQSLIEDLGDLVNDQQGHINILVDNTQNTRDNVVNANENLENACERQKRYRKRKCYFLIILLLLALICAGVYLVDRKTSN